MNNNNGTEKKTSIKRQKSKTSAKKTKKGAEGILYYQESQTKVEYQIDLSQNWENCNGWDGANSWNIEGYRQQREYGSLDSCCGRHNYSTIDLLYS